MKCKSCLAEVIRTCDLFSLTQFLRYDQDEDYKTISGGTISLLVVIIFVIMLASNAVSTVNKTDISWSATTEKSFLSSSTTLTFNPQNNKMVSVGIVGFDLNNPTQRFFDF